MSKAVKWIDGYKTYLLCAAVILCAVLKKRGVEIPEEFFLILIASAVACLRMGVAKAKMILLLCLLAVCLGGCARTIFECRVLDPNTGKVVQVYKAERDTFSIDSQAHDVSVEFPGGAKASASNISGKTANVNITVSPAGGGVTVGKAEE